MMLRPAILALLLLLACPVAAQELDYATTLVPTGEGGLDTKLRDASQLIALARDAPVDANGLVARAEADPRRLEEVLRSEGWWAPRITVTIAGEPAGTPGLAERLAGRAPVPVEIRVDPGPRYTLRRIAVRPATEADAAALARLPEPAGLRPGEPARADAVLDAEAALKDDLLRAGHPLAAVADREVVVDHDAQRMDVIWTLAPGPRADFARPTVEGDTQVNRALIERVAAARLEGQPYSPQRLERARRDVQALGAFDAVRARAADRLDEAGRLPTTFSVTDRPRNAAGINLAYETSFGASARTYYERRNLFGNAETLRLEAEISRIGEGGIATANYRVGANLRRPGLFDGQTAVVADTYVTRERLEAYDRDAFVVSLIFERRLGERWLLRAGPIFETGRIGLTEDTLSPYTLAGLVTAARYDNTNSLLDPTRGWRLDLAATPYADLADGGGFVRMQGTARTYLDITGGGGSVVALRGSVGSVVGDTANIPLDKRFYAGGGGSVRGYTYQSIGPRNAANQPTGGLSLVEASFELRQRISGPIGLVGFLDAGSVTNREAPSLQDMRYGAGLGFRYATAIGPLRLDVGVPLNPQPGDASYAFYVGLGQAF
ncbi:autotransporter assembly complex protein TamA [Falsiroseomonas sp. HW251]|uniref:autotransporter assembly complex protein TamA n=1 Tax=Falsiroseomonas sp. HW251 TaxID=3390998 RepID=UPI003D31E643